ncbi:CBS domain-containing protein [bacterium]|nr:CBS domain-containing protein [bacterium]
MFVRDFMTTELVAVCEEGTVRDLLELLHEKNLPSVPVLDSDGRPQGSVSQNDVLRALDREAPARDPSRIPEDDATALRLKAAHAARSVRVYGEGDPSLSERRVLALLARRVRDVMSRQVTTVDEDTTHQDLADSLVRTGAHRIVVTRDGRAIGLVTASEVLKTAIAATPLAVANSF